MSSGSAPQHILLWVAAIASLLSASAHADAPATIRVDYMHIGNTLESRYALERVVIEPLPWPGNPARTVDDTNRGQSFFEVVDPKSGTVLYSRGFSTFFGEWRSTDEAQRMSRGFEESLRFPKPSTPVRVRLLERDERNAFSVVWSFDLDPDAHDVERIQGPPPAVPISIINNGPSSQKVDLLLLGDGYTAAQMEKFQSDAKRLAARLFSTSPFKERAKDFNVWALAVPTPESGISRPSEDRYRWSALHTRYDIFGSERYMMTPDNRALREIAQYAPYEFVEILANSETYGGGGIFGWYSTVAADSEWANYVFVHEFGHHFAALADEYYTSPVAYQSGESRPEPWEPNVTALHDPRQLKWKQFVKPGTPLPTPWPKKEFEAYEHDYQKTRSQLRADRRPESEMNALFRTELKDTQKMFSEAPHRSVVGAFEGADYAASGYYRPAMQCIMFNRTEQFCEVCQHAIEEIIDLYAPR
jgi:IgA Peptidase M64/Peptidase M64 N-terminus